MTADSTNQNGKSVQPTSDSPLSTPITRRKAAIRIGALILGVVLPLVTTLAPTEARAQETEGS
jgi:hypothetical protein